jgi:hypothetical protein
MSWGKLVDMEMDDEDQLDYPTPISMPERPRHPYGLMITLRRQELEKLGLEANCDVGDYLDIRAFATVKNVHKSDDDECVTLQIEKMAVESEDDEDDED